jgi:hypothetical protein
MNTTGLSDLSSQFGINTGLPQSVMGGANSSNEIYQ